MKKLILIRHAKSSWENPDWTDYERPINKRGLRDAPFMAELLNKKNIKPDLMLCSTAKRAKETAYFFINTLEVPLEKIQYELGIYEMGTKFIINLLSKLDDSIDQVILIGHNPDITSMATYFSGEFFDNIPTCGIVSIIFEFDEWEKITSNNGVLDFYEFPKNYLD